MGPARHSLRWFVFFLLLTFPAAAAEAQETKSASPRSGSGPAAAADPARLNGDIVKTMTAYKASLEELLKVYEQEFNKKVREVPERRNLYEKGYISRLELEQSQRELAAAEARVREVEQKIAEAKIAIAEATAFKELLRLPPLAAGQYMEAGAFIRYNGKANWSLAGAGKIEKFFSDKFGHLLPISALGQTPFHERMRFDHHEAMDVALQPDSSEGRTLMAYLRTAGIPFMAFRNGVPGSATGAHIHIGKPSIRIAP